MEPRDIRAMLNYPNAALVSFAVDQANLTAEERRVLRMREHECETIESTAEKLYTSTDTVKRRQKSAMRKLGTCWDSLGWVGCVIHHGIPQ